MTDTIENTETTEEQPVLALVGVEDGPDDAEAADEAEPTAEAAEPQTDASGPDSPANVKVGPRMSAADEGHLFELRDKLRRREEREAEAHEAHKEAKKATEAAQKELNEYIDELEQGQGNLFRGPRPEVKADATATTTAEPEAPAAPEAWRDEPVSVLMAHGVKVRAITALAEKVPPIETLGQLSDYMAKPYSPLTDIKGIGKVAGENIEAALTAWFLANPEKCPPVKAKRAEPEPFVADKLDWSQGTWNGVTRHIATPQPGTEYTIAEVNGLYTFTDHFTNVDTDFETLAEAKKFASDLEAERQAEANKIAAEETQLPDDYDDGDEVDDYDAESDDESTDESDDDA